MVAGVGRGRGRRGEGLIASSPGPKTGIDIGDNIWAAGSFEAAQSFNQSQSEAPSRPSSWKRDRAKSWPHKYKVYYVHASR